ncbi:MAG: beta-propeller fold lactonase family protein [Solirubrobacteraceae bacterium]|nr:beta-propeller fold lactonase family protein [Solirubrobacteraceae bacterium]
MFAAGCATLLGLVLPGIAAATPGALTPIGQAPGAGGLRAVAVSPDGRHVYAAAQAESRVTAYRREASGLLTQVDVETDGSGGVTSLDGALSIAVSPDGRDVVVAAGGDAAVTTFTRDAATGALTLQGCVNDAGTGGCDAGAGLGGAEGVAVSPEGNSVYVAAPADHALNVLTRNATTGDLTYAGCFKDIGAPGTCTLGEIQGLASAQQVAVAPDGRNVYATGRGDDAVVNLLRAPDGTLTPRNCVSDTGGLCNSATQGLDGARALAVSADGRNVYVTGQIEDAVVSFSRDAIAGDLIPLDLYQNGLGGVSGLNGPEGIAVSADGASVYTGSVDSEALTGFTRDAAGRLTFQQCFKDGAAGSGCGGAEGLNDANAIAVPTDGSHIYVSARGDASVTVFSRETPPPPGGGSEGPPPPGAPPGGAGTPPTPIAPNTPLICVGLWTSTCAGFPPPAPVQTCVSLWQNCTGFGGKPPAGPGTIDLSGFPSSLVARTGCDERPGRNPFTSSRRTAAAAQWVPQDPAASPWDVRDSTTCLVQIHLEGSDPNDAEAAARATLVRQFHAEVDQMEAEHLQGLSVACWVVNMGEQPKLRTRTAKAAQWVAQDPVCPRAPSTVGLFLSTAVQNAFGAAKAADRPVQIVSIDLGRAQALCSGDTQADCMAIARGLAASVEQHLRQLRSRKAVLGLDRPRATRPRDTGAGATAAAGRKRLRIVVGSGRASLRQGRPGRVKLTFGSQARQILRTARRRGHRSLQLTAVTRATIVPGVTTTKRTKVRVLLAAPRRR